MADTNVLSAARRGRRPRIAADLLDRLIEALLEAGPRLADELAHEAGYSLAATRLRLDRLLAQRRVHREKVQFGQPRWQYRWHLGPECVRGLASAPAAVGDEDPGHEPHAADLSPSQRTVSDYPAVGRRDPLVAALFGPAQHKND
jgi:hypothetical protein